ncbi:ATP-grasp domain-containing protein [Salipaludibacillus daqingensis]|uniref:ATP-grasp domain-containing protein n=1 Tax=Salipaludibacillus daqingensis TaxID=3041001 RepID=UPI002474DFFB|nr:RimK family alpha-L-glutamate ligase [Salipaludibacillus daqingensis]
MTNHTGWIIYNGHLMTTKFTDYVQWFREVAEQHGIAMEVKTNDQLIVTNDPTTPIFDVVEKGPAQLPDFIHFADKDLHLARQLNRRGVPIFNAPDAIAICDNKSLMHEHLFDHNIPTPKTMLAPMIYSGMPLKNEQYINAIISELGLPLIIKEAYGSFGQQVYWVNTKEELLDTAKKLVGVDHLYQRPVMTSIGVDLRLNVIGGEVVAAMKRTSATDFRANVTAGGTTEIYHPSAEEKRIAMMATKAVGADFAGVDLLVGKEGPIVCEVNSNPHIRSIYECTGIDVAVPMIDFIIKKVSHIPDRRGV